MKRFINFLIFILFSLVLAFILYSIFFYGKIDLLSQKENLTEEIKKLKKEFIFMKFEVTMLTENHTIINADLYSIDEKLVTNFVLTNRGNDVFIESKVIKIKNENAIVFPIKIYSELIAPVDGFPIYEYYIKDDRVLIYESNEKLANFANWLFYKFVIEENLKTEKYFNLIDTHFNAVIHTVNGVKEGKRYECILLSKGELQLREVEND